MLLTSLDDSKWQPLYLSNLYVIIFLGRQQVTTSLFEQLVYLQPYYISALIGISRKSRREVCHESLPSEVGSPSSAKLIHFSSIFDLEL